MGKILNKDIQFCLGAETIPMSTSYRAPVPDQNLISERHAVKVDDILPRAGLHTERLVPLQQSSC